MTSGTSMVLTGCIVHGYGIFLYLVDEGMPTGASWTIEVVSQLKVKLKVVSQFKKNLAPKHLNVQNIQGDVVHRQGLHDCPSQ